MQLVRELKRLFFKFLGSVYLLHTSLKLFTEIKEKTV